MAMRKSSTLTNPLFRTSRPYADMALCMKERAIQHPLVRAYRTIRTRTDVDIIPFDQEVRFYNNCFFKHETTS